MSYLPTLSVIIPTHNRRALLYRVLTALDKQTCPAHTFEVIVVCDGCTDGTAAALQSYRPSYDLRVIEQAAQGPGAARNRGVAAARGALLLFIDDDVEPAATCIAAHVAAHATGAHVVLGPYPPALPAHATFVQQELRAWWSDCFTAAARPGHRFTYRDLLGGNLSLTADLFAQVGGFDPALQRHQDQELGIRLLAAGAALRFAPDARAVHHDHSDLARTCRIRSQEGYADVQIGQRHPALRPILPLAYVDIAWSRRRRLLRRLAFAAPGIGEYAAALLHRALKTWERLRLRTRWRRDFEDLADYCYWRGVAHALGSRRALDEFLQDGSARGDQGGHGIELDLREGLEQAEQRLDRERPAEVRLRYGPHLLGRIPPQPGAEALRGVHLRPALAGDLAVALLVALAAEGATALPGALEPLARTATLHLSGAGYGDESH